MFPFALTIFLSAYLLFQVQPVIARFILPWYGGSPAVWTTCMCFFQIALLIGYLYSDVVARRIPTKVQALIHIAVMVATLVTLPIIPRAALKPTGGEDPSWSIIKLLMLTVAPAYCLLATTGPLIQSWFARSFRGRSPYRLFALSNLGSLLALISYPLVFEPTMSIVNQAWMWSIGYLLFVVSCSWCAVSTLRATNEISPADGSRATLIPEGISPLKLLAWVVLATIPSVLLLAVTNELSQDVSVVPMLWIVPLSLYLISFIICFDRPVWYRRDLFGTLLICSSMASVVCLVQPTSFGFFGQFAIYNTMLFAAVMTCHGELARMKPDHESLTLYYLMMSVGGAFGGILVVVVAPLVFQRFHELPVAMVAAIGVTLGRWIWVRDGVSLTRVMLAVSILTSSAIVVSSFYLQDLIRQFVVARLGVVASVLFVALSLLGWQHLTRKFLPSRLLAKSTTATRMDRLLWLATFGLVFLFSLWLVTNSRESGGWASLLTLAVVGLIWGVGLYTHFRPVVSLAMYTNLGIVFAFFLIQLVAVGAFFGRSQQRGKTLELKRNFFGICGVGEHESPIHGTFREIFNGRIGHGQQFLREDIKNKPNLYYGPDSGIGLAFTEHPLRLAGKPIKVAVIGLGTGTLAAWGGAGDSFIFYEINPAVIELADRYFTYRQDTPSKTETLLGDARILLENDLQQNLSRGFDLLIVDAFSGDSIPRHLLTREAMDVYRRHLAPGGIVAIHISNHYLDLRPVVQALAHHAQMKPITVFDVPERSVPGNERLYPSDWMLVTGNAEFLKRPRVAPNVSELETPPVLWTDDFGSILHVVKVKIPGN
jgi:hypothetical protein